MAIAAAHRRAHGQEHEVGLADRRIEFGREADPPHAQVPLEELLEARFVDRHAAMAELVDPPRILIDAGDIPAELGEASGGDEADIARPNHANVHEMCP